ncbi:hypothetical protein WANA34_1340, partial [Wolbachia endosymbiont of Drosophila ananassae]
YLFRSPCLPYSATPLNGYRSFMSSTFLNFFGDNFYPVILLL